jgi:hypothetical protein
MPQSLFLSDIQCPTCLSVCRAEMHTVVSAVRQSRAAVGDSNNFYKKVWTRSDTEVVGIFLCTNCSGPMWIAMRQRSSVSMPDDLTFAERMMKTEEILDLQNVADVTDIHPSTASPVPTHLPPTIEDYWRREVVHVMRAPGHLLSAARKILEAVCKLQDPSQKKGTSLHERIKELWAKGLIIESMKDWGINIKKLGNVGSHRIEEKVTREEADEVLNYTVLFVDLLYRIPERVEELRLKAESDGS